MFPQMMRFLLDVLLTPLSKSHSVAAHQIHHIPRARCERVSFSSSSALLTSLRALGSSSHQSRVPKSGERTPNPHPPAPPNPPVTLLWIHRGLGQVDNAAMKEQRGEDLPTRAEGRREERDEWQRWRGGGDRKGGRGGRDFKNNNNNGKKTNNRERRERSRRSSEAPKVLELIKMICIYL